MFKLVGKHSGVKKWEIKSESADYMWWKIHQDKLLTLFKGFLAFLLVGSFTKATVSDKPIHACTAGNKAIDGILGYN